MNRNRLKRNEVVLLLLPVLILAGLAVAFRQSHTTIAIENVKIYPPDQNFNTQVNVKLRYRAASPYKQVISGPTWELDARKTYIVDEKGKRYTKFNNGGWQEPIFSYWSGKGQFYTFGFWLPLQQIPQSAGKLTLKSVIAADDSEPLSVSVVVCNKRN